MPPQKSGMSCGIIVAICAAVAVPVLGIMAAIAIPAFTKYMRRSKTSEARVQLANLFDAMSAHYGEHLKCPGDLEGSAGVTPPVSLNCSTGENGRCTPGGTGPGGYDAALWTDHPVWSALGFEMRDSHYFHYDVTWTEQPGGSCQFTVQAFGDLDDDGIFSTFERAGGVDINGVNAAAGLYIDQEVE